MTTRINNPYAAVSPRSLSPSLAPAVGAPNSLGVSAHSVDSTPAAASSFYGTSGCAATAVCSSDHYTRQASFATTCSSTAGCSCYQVGANTTVAAAPSSPSASFHPAAYHHQQPQFYGCAQQQQPQMYPAMMAMTAAADASSSTTTATTAMMVGAHLQCEHCSTAASTPRSANTPSSSTSSSSMVAAAAAVATNSTFGGAEGDVAYGEEEEAETDLAADDNGDGMFSRQAAAAQTTEFGYGYYHEQPQQLQYDGDAAAGTYHHHHDGAYVAAAASQSSVFPEPDAAAVVETTTTTMPAMLHAHALTGVVPFVPYDRDARLANMSTPPRCAVPREALCRLFIGQLPYTLSDSELAWCFYVLTNGQATIFYIERIVHWRNGRQPSGCVHAYCYPRDRDTILALNQRVLFDECGLWVASSSATNGNGVPVTEDRRALAQYCAFLSADKTHRAAQRPYQCMCVQVATSTYLPHLERQRRMHAARAAQASRPAVFSGAAAVYGGVQARLFGAGAPHQQVVGAVPMYNAGPRAAVPAPSAYAQLAPHAW